MSEHRALEKNLIDLVAEQQAKLGYRAEAVRLYYPLQSLRHFYDCQDSADEMQARLADFAAATAETLGAVKVSHEKERFCFVIPPEGSVYVHAHEKENGFIRQLVALISAHASLEDIERLFAAQPAASEVTPIVDGEFDVLIRFLEGEDSYYYCFKTEGCHVIYHRFLPADYAEFL